jgi:hypothetical protein
MFPDQTNPQYTAIEFGDPDTFYFQQTYGVLADGSASTTVVNTSSETVIGSTFSYEEGMHTVAQDDGSVSSWTTTQVDTGTESYRDHETYHYDLLV